MATKTEVDLAVPEEADVSLGRCSLCGGKTDWQYNCSFEEIGLEGIGFVHVSECEDCGARIATYLRYDK